MQALFADEHDALFELRRSRYNASDWRRIPGMRYTIVLQLNRAVWDMSSNPNDLGPSNPPGPVAPAAASKNATTLPAPCIDPGAFVARGAVVVGNVVLAADASIWFQAVVRGDSERIFIGPRSNVQDGCVLHADPGFPCQIAAGVTIGHGAIVHGAVVEENVLLGMRCVVMNGARIGANSIVAVGAVVTEGTVIPPGSLVVGLPGKVKRPLSAEEIERNRHAADHYVAAGRRFRAEGWAVDSSSTPETPGKATQ